MQLLFAVWKATERVFPRAGRRGCYFHFTQAIWQKIQVLGSLQFIGADFLGALGANAPR